MSVDREHRVSPETHPVHTVQREPSVAVTGANTTKRRAQGMRRPRRRVKLANVGLIGITQTILGRGPEFGEPTGNAMQAALATVFGLPLTTVPHFTGMELEEGWWDVMNAWLEERYGLALISCTAGEWEMPSILHLSQGLAVGEIPHVVVAFGGQLLHDPHPSGRGLETVLSHELFVSVRPGGSSAMCGTTRKHSPQLVMIAQAQPLPELALSTTLAPAGVKRCTRVEW